MAPLTLLYQSVRAVDEYKEAPCLLIREPQMTTGIVVSRLEQSSTEAEVVMQPDFGFPQAPSLAP